MSESKFTKKELKGLVRRTNVAEVLSGLELKIAKGAIDVKNHDPIDVAHLLQIHTGTKEERIKKVIKDTEMYLFNDLGGCKIPVLSSVDMILTDDIYIVKAIH